MFDLSAMTIAGNATADHVLSARPDAPTVPECPPRVSGHPVRRVTAWALRRLVDRLDPDHAPSSVVAS
jgi:hypothetical protein